MSTMKLLTVLWLFVAGACGGALPRDYKDNNRILHYKNENSGHGNYKYEFITSDNTRQEQQGELRNAGRGPEYLAVKGEYSWVAPDGVRYSVAYTADENGYKSDMSEIRGAAPIALVAALYPELKGIIDSQ